MPSPNWRAWLGPSPVPAAVVGAGAILCLLLAAVDRLAPGDHAGVLEAWMREVAGGAVFLALVIRARIAGPRALDYELLVVASGLIVAGMLFVDLQPVVGATVVNTMSNGLFAVGGAVSCTVILPALYRKMNRELVALALLDAGVMMCAGTAIALNFWHEATAGSASELFIALVAAAIGASAGVALLALLESRAMPRPAGAWASVLSLPILGIAWASLVASMAGDASRPMAVTGGYVAGILLLGFGWVTWSDEISDDDRYGRVARLLGDWLPVVSLVLCVAMNLVPHDRFGGVDVVAVGSLGAVFFSIGRQWILLHRERGASKRLVGEQLLRAEKEAAESANRANRAFLATMSHEIRTPMNSILGNAHLLKDSELAPADRESVEAIENGGQELLSLINDILDFSKIEAERMELERVGFAPARLIKSVLGMFAGPARQRGLTLSSEVDPAIPVILAGDPHRLHQILNNLVNNAMKFTSTGGITIRARVLERGPIETGLRFEVADTGIGIDPEVLPKLFSPFVQGDASTTRRFGGSGLGLAICKSLVNLMGGQIGAESTPGEGSTFWFTVRLGTATDQEADAVLLDNEYTDRTVVTTGARVLVAEDNPANVRLIERLLDRQGIEVVCARNGREAVEAVERDDFDLVLMDCQMPEIDGLDATRAIRANGRDLPIVALTANALNSDRTACYEAGMNDYLSKPIRQHELNEALRRWLRLSPSREEATRTSDSPTAALFELYRDELEPAQVNELLALDPDGSAGFLDAMIESYHATLTECMPRLGSAIGTSDWERVEEASHKLKGVAANMGLRQVHEKAARIVAQVRAGETDELGPLFAELVSSLGPTDLALAAVRAVMPSVVDDDAA